MARSLYRPAIIIPVSIVLLVALVMVISNLFDIRIGLKPSTKEDDRQTSSAQKTDHPDVPPAMMRPPRPGADGRDGESPSNGAGKNARKPPQLGETPAAFMTPYLDLMGDIGATESMKQKALGALQSFDAEMKAQMNAAIRGEAPPSPEVFKEMETRRDEKLRSILGEKPFETYKQNIDTIPERAAISNIQKRLERAGAGLSEAQSKQLLQAMVDGGRSSNTTESASGVLDGRAAVDSRFERSSEALRAATSDLTEAQKTEINRFIDETKEMRSRMKKRF